MAKSQQTFNKIEKEKRQREANRQEMEKLRTSFEKEIKVFLTKEQQKQFDDFRAKHDPRKGEKSKPNTARASCRLRRPAPGAGSPLSSGRNIF